MSEYFGSKDFELLRQSMATMLLSGAAVGVAVSLLCVILTPFLLRAMAVPKEIYDITVIYLRINFIGLLNAVLDLIFLGMFGFGIVCSAVTTVAAVSAVLACAYMLSREKE